MTDAKLREYEEAARTLRADGVFTDAADAIDALAAEVRAKGASVDRLLRALGEKEQRVGVLEGERDKLVAAVQERCAREAERFGSKSNEVIVFREIDVMETDPRKIADCVAASIRVLDFHAFSPPDAGSGAGAGSADRPGEGVRR